MLRLPNHTALLAGLAVMLSGCDMATGPKSGSETQVLLAQGSAAARSIAAALLSSDPVMSQAVAAGPVALENVASIDMTITRVDALPAQQDTTRESAWVSLEVTAGGGINLLALPAADAGGLTLARAELPAGKYGHVRLFVKDATITFKEPVRVGQHTYAANQKISLFIPSGDQTGLKTAVSFSVAEGNAQDVKLIFDAAASVNRIIVTGAGTVILPPVLGARAED